VILEMLQRARSDRLGGQSDVRIIAGVIAQCFNKGSLIALRFIELPVFIYLWQPDLYGKWLSLIAMAQLTTLSDFGFTTAACNRIAYCYSRSEFDQARSAIGTTLTLNAASALLFGSIAAIALMMGQDVSRMTILLVVGSAVLTMQCRAIGSILSALGNFSNVILADTIFAISQSAMSLLFAYALGGFAGAAFGLMFAAILYVCGLGIYCRIRLLALSISGIRANVRDLTILLRPSIFLLIFPAAMWFQLQGIILLITWFFSPADAVLFVAMRTIARIPLALSNIVVHPMAPELAMALGRGGEAYRQMFSKASKSALAIVLPTGLLASVTGPVLSRIWLGGEVTLNGWIFYPLLISACLEAIRAMYGFGLVAALRHEVLAVACLGAYGLYFLCAWLMHATFSFVVLVALLSSLEIPLLVLSIGLHGRKMEALH
jgi:O-antigen/teichoic acid export membrane protein